MKNTFRCVAAAAFVGLAALASQAQTNLVENLGIHLTVISQGVAITNGNEVIQNADVARVGTKDVINVLGTATGNAFSSAAELLRVTPIIDGTNGVTSTVVQDGTNAVDVSGFFSFSTDGSVVRNATSAKGKVRDATRYSIRTMSLKDQTGFPALTIHFEVQGFDISTFHRAVLNDGMVVGGHYASWTVNGTGDHHSRPIIIEGEITVNFDDVSVAGGL